MSEVFVHVVPKCRDGSVRSTVEDVRLVGDSYYTYGGAYDPTSTVVNLSVTPPATWTASLLGEIAYDEETGNFYDVPWSPDQLQEVRVRDGNTGDVLRRLCAPSSGLAAIVGGRLVLSDYAVFVLDGQVWHAFRGSNWAELVAEMPHPRIEAENVLRINGGYVVGRDVGENSTWWILPVEGSGQ